MKYISLKCLMRAYARMAGQKHVYECLLLCSTPTADMPDQIFHISSRIVEEDGKRQMIKTVNPLIQNLFGISSRILPASLEIYPVLELQWYWEETHPAGEQFRLLEQLSYAVLFCVLARNLWLLFQFIFGHLCIIYRLFVSSSINNNGMMNMEYVLFNHSVTCQNRT